MWFFRRYAVPLALEDPLSESLAAAGSLGSEVMEEPDRVVVKAWFAAPPEEGGDLPTEIGESREGVLLLDEGWQREEDWLAVYRSHVRPTTVGRFVLDPREPSETPPELGAGQLLLRVPARTAFGTGSHPSTRLALSWIEERIRPGATLLDVGCGSGILSLAAARLGARPVGFDVDPIAAFTAGQYARLNRRPEVGRRLFAGTAEALGETGFDLVVVNVLPHLVAAATGAIASHVRAGGELIVSGLLGVEAAEVQARWETQGLVPCGLREEGEWASLRLERPR